MDTKVEHTQQQEPPELAHITTNIIPLSTVLRKFSEFSYAELSHVIQTQPNNDAKKKKLLELIVYLRQEYMRLYVLTKWSKISAKDFTKLIDILAWLRQQTDYFTNLIWAVKSINQSLLSAKLPNPDLITALEVLNNGRPTLPTHNLLESRITTKKILETLEDLNVVISMKFALVENLPDEFKDYSIKDGRISIFTKDYKFELSAIDENSPFFIINFKFINFDHDQNNDQGINIGNNPQVSKHLIKICNEILRADNFQELHRVLTNYTNTVKLYLIHTKLNELKNIKHVYHADKFQIVVNYWINSFVFKNSYIEIGLSKKTEKICYKWYKQGEFQELFEDVDHVEDFLKEIYYKHSQKSLKKIENLTVNKSVLQINELTGIFYFKNSTPTLNNFLKKLNLDDFNNINENLRSLRRDLKFNEASTILNITGWIQNDLIKLNLNDFKKISQSMLNGLDVDESSNNIHNGKNWKFFTRNEWPSNWCLMLFIDNKIKPFIGNVRSIMGQSSLISFTELNIEFFEYKTSKNLINYVSKKIMIHLITQELKNSEYKVVEESNLIIVKTDTFIKIPDCSDVTYLSFKIDDPIKKTMLIKVKSRLNKEIKIEDFPIGSNGVFELSETIEFKSVSILKNFIDKLEKLSKIIELINFLKLEKLNLVNVKLDELTFKYGDHLCTLKDDLKIQLPPNNPHNVYAASIQKFNEYIRTSSQNKADSVGKIFKYLQDSSELVTKLRKFSEIAENQFLSNYDLSKLSYQVVFKNPTFFSILYYKKNSSNRIAIELTVEIKLNDQNEFIYLFKISGDDQSKFKQDFAITGSFSSKEFSDVLPLNDSLLVGSKGLNNTLDYFHNKFLSL
ncbi:hypothetical protein WICMUC_000222 [Wickerhamomyces mucosus]|uniref:Mediator of RNA polymerase II transcription subunit 14 n=1 Tax=Wickerhamomyces mucosus TaxID=1378264 RepID=A0A9P8TJ76_9ASCO|nr:hypothetical protein WICMUC_000222 [Wickerhamomyces mucosus]